MTSQTFLSTLCISCGHKKGGEFQIKKKLFFNFYSLCACGFVCERLSDRSLSLHNCVTHYVPHVKCFCAINGIKHILFAFPLWLKVAISGTLE